jgi:predicted NAD/FAD-binding protein
LLQRLASPHHFCVTLNHTAGIDPASVLRRFTYHHPIYTPRGVAAQKRHAEISGLRRTHYCGAYWGFGFHEDGVKSALAVCRRFGKGLEP